MIILIFLIIFVVSVCSFWLLLFIRLLGWLLIRMCMLLLLCKFMLFFIFICMEGMFFSMFSVLLSWVFKFLLMLNMCLFSWILVVDCFVIISILFSSFIFFSNWILLRFNILLVIEKLWSCFLVNFM